MHIYISILRTTPPPPPFGPISGAPRDKKQPPPPPPDQVTQLSIVNSFLIWMDLLGKSDTSDSEAVTRDPPLSARSRSDFFHLSDGDPSEMGSTGAGLSTTITYLPSRDGFPCLKTAGLPCLLPRVRGEIKGSLIAIIYLTGPWSMDG